MFKKLVSLLLPAVMIFGMTAWAEPAQDDNLVYTTQGPIEFYEVPWYNPGAWIYEKVLWETLIGMDENMQPATGDGMAESYSMSEDGLTLTIQLRDGLKWSDGEAVTGEDVIWSISSALNPAVALNSVIGSAIKNIVGADEVVAGEADTISGVTYEGNTVTVQFKEVSALSTLGLSLFYVLPKHCLENADLTQLQQDSYFQNPIGSGPFKIEEVVMGEYALYEPVEGYWGGTADFKIYSNPSAMDSDPNLVTNAKAGLVDYAYTKSYADVQALSDVEGVSIVTVPVNYTRWFYFNEFPHEEGGTSPFADVRVRQAVAYAVDTELICEQIFEGAAMPGDSTATPTGSMWKSPNTEKFSYDPEKAKELLAEAGWDPNYEVVCFYYYTDQQTVDLMAIVQSMLSDVGIKFTPKLAEGDLAAILNALPTTRDLETGVSNVEWDMMYGALSATCIFDYYSGFASTGSWNYFPLLTEVDEMYQSMVHTTDEATQKDLYEQLEQWHTETLPRYPLYYQPIWIVVSDKIAANVETWGNVQFHFDWQIQNWKLAE